MTFPSNLTTDILESLSEGVFTVDKSFRINFMNRAAERITGFPREEVIGKFCKYVFRAELCSHQCPIAVVLESGRDLRDFEYSIYHRNGNNLHIRINAAVLRNRESEPVGGVISFRNLSEYEAIRKNLEKSAHFHGIIGHGKSMREIFDLIEEIADTDATVLIQGDSGTGKEMIANAIQSLSTRSDKPFIKVNCSVFTPQLLASELFGHVKGAFTGAIKDRLGRFEMAHTGTLFLDEVAETPLEMQIQLLRVLQEGTFERVGESLSRKVDVRVIAATNKNLSRALADSKFREDLYYRLNVIPIHVPSLQEHPEDIPYLVRHFLQKYSLLYQKTIDEIEDGALEILVNQQWRGNVRELENSIEYAFARTKSGSVIQACKLPPTIRHTVRCRDSHKAANFADDEAARIFDLLQKYRWNKSKVAKIMGIGRTTLWRKIRRFDLEIPE
ncbi:MAG: sigma 54-interacting transcriptional regulator [Calditrichia bacterium]